MVWMMWLHGMASAQEVPTEPGVYQLTADVLGSARNYTLVVPKRSKKKRKQRPPLVLALHYGGPVSPHYSTPFVTQLIQPGLDELGAVIVAPDCPGQGWSDPESEAVALWITDRVAQQLQTDPDRRMVTGFSMGGAGAWHMAARFADQFQVAVPIAGHPGELAPSVDIPIYAIHGTHDEVMPIGATDSAVSDLNLRGVRATLIAADGVTHYDTSRYVALLQGAVRAIEQQWVLGH